MFIINKIADKIIVFWCLILSILYSFLSVLRHDHFQSGAFDLGIFDQAIWQYSRFIYPFNTIKEKFILGDHFNLTLPLFAPFYWIWSDVRIILIVQAFWIVFSSIAIYKLSKLRKFSNFVSLGIAFIYSLFWGFQFAVYFDFHPIIIAVGLLAWMIYFFEAKKTKLFWVTLVSAILTQENVGIALASLGFIYLFKKEYRKQAVLFILFGLFISFAFTKIISLLSPTGYQYWPEVSLNPVYTAIKFFDSFDKRLVWLYSFSWFSFLPLFSPGTIIAIVLDLAQYFLPVKEFGHMVTPFLHHRAILNLFLILGTIDVLLFLKKRKINIEKLMILLIISSLAQQFVFHFPVNKLSKPIYWKSESWMKDNQSLFKQIPSDASIAASQNIVPHLSQRSQIYLIWPRKTSVKGICGSCWWLEFSGKPKYMMVDLHSGQWVTQLLETNENFQAAVDNMKKAGRIKEVKKINDAYLYEVNYR